MTALGGVPLFSRSLAWALLNIKIAAVSEALFLHLMILRKGQYVCVCVYIFNPPSVFLSLHCYVGHICDRVWLKWISWFVLKFHGRSNSWRQKWKPRKCSWSRFCSHKSTAATLRPNTWNPFALSTYRVLFDTFAYEFGVSDSACWEQLPQTFLSACELGRSLDISVCKHLNAAVVLPCHSTVQTLWQGHSSVSAMNLSVALFDAAVGLKCNSVNTRLDTLFLEIVKK